METALTTPEQNKLLQLARSQMGAPRLPLIPQIKMVNNMSEVKGLQKGEYFISQSVKQGDEYVTEEKSIGMNPEIVILMRLYSYSKYSKAKEKLVAWTNELSDFNEDVYLMNNSGDAPVLEIHRPYQEFKKYIRENYWDAEEDRSTLKFRNVLYVLFEGKVYRMFVSSASVTGEKADGTRGDYKHPEPLSLAKFQEGLRGPEPGSLHYFERKCRLGSSQTPGKDYLLMTFENVGPVDSLETVVETWARLRTELDNRFNAEFGALTTRVSSEITADDLPSF